MAYYIISFLKYDLGTTDFFQLFNYQLSITDGDSFFYHQYLISENILNMDIKDPKWVDEVDNDLIT